MSASGASNGGRPAPGAAAPSLANDRDTGVLAGRPDLEKDALKELRDRQRALKSEAKRVATDLKNKKKQKKRAMKRCATLGTRDLVQVLLERGVVMQSVPPTNTGGSSASTEPAAVMALTDDAADAVPDANLAAIEDVAMHSGDTIAADM